MTTVTMSSKKTMGMNECDGCWISGCCYEDVATVNTMVKVVVTLEEMVVVVLVSFWVYSSFCCSSCPWKKNYEDYYECNDLLREDPHETSTVILLPLPLMLLLMLMLLWYRSFYCCCSSLLFPLFRLCLSRIVDWLIDSWLYSIRGSKSSPGTVGFHERSFFVSFWIYP